ncbi:GIN domain-containing protein [Persicobacter diffluens]|uniref:Putative auto-transporter adhesin head GIN domain-containing protein n=1 Tax=Persicobacter diffluens TaxID=981 RepID=A0AAN4VZ54_9BACT|nr:hypothetical protein PEDI_19340 [Persicobacter diffluens]
MKKIALSLLVAASLFSCSKDDDPTNDNNLITVAQYENVKIGGALTITASTEGAANELRINAPENLASKVNATVVDGELYITADASVSLEDNVSIEIYPPSIGRIVLERDQHAVYHGLLSEDLEIVTEAESQLELYGTVADNVSARLEGASYLILDSHLETIADSADYYVSNVELVDEKTLLLDGRYLIAGEEIVLFEVADGEDFFRVYGDDINTYWQLRSVDYITQGSTELEAIEAPSSNVNIKLEGSSQASVWAMDQLSGKGEGSSILYYFGDPSIDYRIEGGAQLIPVE